MNSRRSASFGSIFSVVVFTHILLAAVHTEIVAQSRDSLLKEVRYLQDQRSEGSGRLGSLMRSADARIRLMAVLAAANIADTSLLKSVQASLSDTDPQVREAAAYALGQVSGHLAFPMLVEALRGERNRVVVRRLCEALGKTSPPTWIDSLLEIGQRMGSRLRRPDLIDALLRFGIRGLKSERAIWYCFDALRDPSAVNRWRSLYALWRMAPHAVFATEVANRADVLRRLTRDASPEVRLNLATLLGRVETTESAEILLALANRESRSAGADWRVLVQVSRALIAHARKDVRAARELVRLARGKNHHVLVAIAQGIPTGIAAYQTGGLAESLKVRLSDLTFLRHPGIPEAVSSESMIALLRLFPEESKAVATLWLDTSASVRRRTKIIEALSSAPTETGIHLTRNALHHPTVPISMAAWDFIRRYFRGAGARALLPDQEAAASVARELFVEMSQSLRRNDMGISTVISTLLADSAFGALLSSGGVRSIALDSLVAALGRMRSPDDVEAIQAAMQTLGRSGHQPAIPAIEVRLRDSDAGVRIDAATALGRLGGADSTVVSPVSAAPEYSDYDWRLMKSIGLRPRAVIRTEKGTVEMEFMPADAPFTVLSFWRLAVKGFFDGLTFHRVVPNFVVQGGDPRGDGWGGPGYSIRTETSLASFERGFVGMASSGKDTEGCQFFITHTPTPHLDGRYTIFARVVRGMSVVDQLSVGDKIISVRVRPGS